MTTLPLAVLFASPALALFTAAGAAAVPVVIHLLNRRRYRVTDWAAMRFLLAAQRRAARRMRLEQWLLLAARVLAVVLIACAMAAVSPWAERAWQAVWPGGGPGGPVNSRTHKVVVLDASYSMGLRDADGTTRFDAARDRAAAFVRSSPAGDAFSVVLLGSPPQTVVPGPSDDAGRVAAEIDALKLPHGTADLGAGLNTVAELLRRSPGRYSSREVVVFTDMQRSLWAGPAMKSAAAGGEAAPGVDAWQQVTSSARVVVADVGLPGADNLAVTGLTLADPLVLARSPVAVTVTVQNHGAAERKGVRVELLAGRARDGRPPDLRPVGASLADVPAGASVAVSFPHAFAEPGDHVLQARTGPDALDLDDVRSLAVAVRETVPVLVVDGKPAAEPYERAGQWLADALNPFPDGTARGPLYPARPRVIGEAQFADAGLGDLSGSECVFLCDVPRVSEREAARLEAHLRRGGGVVIALGPGTDLEAYNRVLYRGGAGLLPARLTGVARAPRDGAFALAADEESYQHPPLDAFASDDARAGLLAPRFRQYVRAELPPRGPARRVLSFLPGAAAGKQPRTPGSPPKAALDPCVVEWPRHRGRVVLVTTTLNTDWGTWPLSPSFPPLVQELLRLAVLGPPRHTASVGEPLEDVLPPAFAGLEATVVGPDGRTSTSTVAAADDAGVFRFADTALSGLYRVKVSRRPEAVFAVNVPLASAAGGAEGDLRRIDPAELTGSAPAGDVQVVPDPRQADRSRPAPGAETPADAADTPPSPRGPGVAAWLLAAAVALLAAEGVLAWRFGAARAAGAKTEGGGRPWVPAWVLALPLVPAAVLAAVLAHAAATGDVLGFLPSGARAGLERWFDVPAAAPGEGTRWRLEFRPYPTGDARADAWLAPAVAAGLVLLAALVYRRERRAAAAGVLLPLALRVGLLALAAAVLLPQARLLFEREGWPDVALVIDDSRSMATADAYADPAVREKARELAGVGGLTGPQRLALARALVTRPGGDWVGRLLTDRHMKVHVYHCSRDVRKIAEAAGPEDVPAALAAVRGLEATGESSQLGAAVRSVLGEFRGSALAAVVVLTDGVTTEGEDLAAAGARAARAGVPLYLVGVGDASEPTDLVLHDLAVEDAVNVGDRLVFEARLTARGLDRPAAVAVTLSEKKGDGLKPVARTTVQADPSGRPVKVRVAHRPAEAGDKVYVIEATPLPGEADVANNRVQRLVVVTEARRARVLYVEGYPRYEWRFVKALLEREAATRGTRTVELKVLLADADRDFAEQDKSAVAEMPGREELFGYDVVILGDVDPRHPRLGERNLQLLADFVRERGGGLLVVAGPQFTPRAYRDTPLADVLPVVPDPDAAADDPAAALTAGYRPRLTPTGQLHPLFRFTGDEAENAAAWGRLQPMYWSSGGYRAKPAAEVLAVHPEKRSPKGGELPLVLQQFVGGGRVMFFGFEETWRWRYRGDEARFNQFWYQAVRYLARQRVSRTELRLDRQAPYRRGEPIRVTVRFPDDAPPPPADAPVRATLERSPPRRPGDPPPPAGSVEVETVQLAKVEGSRATYEALVTRTPEGEYRFALGGAGEGPRPVAEARVLPPPGELDRVRLNRADLERAAAESHGKFYTLADADRLPDDVPAGSRVSLDQPRPPWLLWAQPGVYGLCLALLACEWVLRKRRHLL